MTESKPTVASSAMLPMLAIDNACLPGWVPDLDSAESPWSRSGQTETQLLAKPLVKSSIPISRDGKMMNQAEFLYNLGLCKSKTLFHGRNAQLLKVRKESSTAKRV